MLQGENISLRLVREPDLEIYYKHHQDISNRGEYYPIGIMSEPILKKKFQETGLWEENHGTLLIVTEEDEIIGEIEFFQTVSYLDELEIAYIIFSKEHRGKGATTEALKLMTGYLFDTKKINRIRLMIHPENIASKKVAGKNGYQFEGIARGAWFNRGNHHDLEVYAILRHEFYRDD